MLLGILCGLCCLSLGSEVAASEKFPAGTLLVMENCNSVVEGWSQSSVGHVAIAFPENGQCCVYEATPGCVRKVSLEDYQAELAALNLRRRQKLRVKVYSPEESFSEDEVTAMRCYLDTQLGRRYSIANYARNRVGDGIHCAELASHTLNHSGRFEFTDCHRITPGTLTERIAEHYNPPTDLAVPTAIVKEDWCTRSWRQWTGYSQWCRWSFGEAWSWCW
jgi:hypothetical protein